MPTAIAITLPWGRYHATPWGRHVNEGAIEWPPAPWRLLRALYATWKTRVPELRETEVFDVLGALVEPPTYVLPEFAEAHTRHYMPDREYRTGASESTDKVIDTFAVIEHGEQIVVEWPTDLSAAQRDVLAEIVSRVPYLGRAESICDAHLLEVEPPRAGTLCVPLPDQESVGSIETLRLLAIESPLREEALTARTTDVRHARLRRPAGTRWISYAKPEPHRGASHRPARARSARVDSVRWSIATNVQPSVHAAVAMCDVLRRACMGVYGRREQRAVSPILAGKDEHDKPLVGHRHAHYLALDVDHDGLLDHLVLWAPAGLDRKEVAALATLDELRGYAFVEDFRACELGLEAMGSIDVVGGRDLVGPSRYWRSVTPFAPGHHGRPRTAWRDHIEAQVRSELRARDLSQPERVELLTGPWLVFRRHRPTKERLRDARRATGVRLHFAEPVQGPITLGALCHFGLGLFAPDD